MRWPWAKKAVAEPLPAPPAPTPLYIRLEDNLALLQERLGNPDDLEIRRFTIPAATPVAAALVFIGDLVRVDAVSAHVMRPLLAARDFAVDSQRSRKDLIAALNETCLFAVVTENVTDTVRAIEAVVNGNVLLLLDESRDALSITVPSPDGRNVDEPQVEQVITGPRDGFVEDIRTNRRLLRMRLRTDQLRVENFRVGTLTSTEVSLLYLKGVANDAIVAEARNRIKRLRVDAVLDVGHIQELIEDAPLSLFPTLGSTERPDVCVAQLLEGNVAILTEGSPVAMFAPVTFFTFFQSPDDYYARYPGSTWVRILRLLGLLISTCMPALAVAIINFHPELLPVSLLISIAEGRERVPFPLVLEILGMDITFELLREAGLRMPRAIGHALSILGALVLGQAAIQAGLVGPHAILIVAITAITSFLVGRVQITQATRLLRFLLLISAGVLGMLGLVLAFVVVMVHQVSLRSFGVPYMYPLAPLNLEGLKDVLFRAPRWTQQQRPSAYVFRESDRMQAVPPQPPKEGRA